MKLFSNLFKAKWQHKDPEIRKQALLKLDPGSNQDILLDAVKSDELPEIRILAVKRIANTSQLKAIAAENSDAKTRELAYKLLCQMYSGEIYSEFSLEQLAEQCKQLDDQNIIEYICKNGVNTSIRRNAINMLNRDSLLGNLAINDQDPSLRVLAARKITQQSTLERVYKNVKTRDKTVSVIVKIKLDQLIEAQQAPLRHIELQKNLCAQYESLGKKGLWEQDKIQAEHIEKQWNELDSHEQKFLTRFNLAEQNFTDLYNSYLERQSERFKQEGMLAPIKQQKQTVIDHLNKLQGELQINPELEEIEKLKTQFYCEVANWKAIEQLPADIEGELASQYLAIHDTLKKMFQQIKQNSDQLLTLTSLQAALKKALTKPALLDEKTVSTFENQVEDAQALPVQAGQAAAQPIKIDIKNLLAKAKELLNNKQQAIKKQLERLDVELQVMENRLTTGALTEAIATRKNAQNAVAQLEKLGYRQLNEVKKRLTSATSHINELSKWRSWANTPQKEALCQKIEALIGSEEHPKDIAFIITQANKDWKNLGPSERDSSQQLWERFQAACEAAYAPCKEYFAEESAHKKDNYQKRLNFVEDLEKFLAAADWNNIDWKKIESLFRHSRTEWQNLGYTEVNQRKALNKRFYAAYETIKTQLNIEWEKNKDKKKQLIIQAQALATEAEFGKAISSAKKLQSQWKDAGRIPQAQERAMWTEFKTACDNVFDQREQIKIEEKQTLQKLLQQKTELYNNLNKITLLPAAEMIQHRVDFESMLRSFKKIRHTIKPEDDKLEKLLADTLNAYERKLEVAVRFSTVKKLATLQKCIKALENIEHAIGSDLSPLEINENIEAAQQIIDVEKNKISNQLVQQIEQRLDNVIKIASTQNFAEALKTSMALAIEKKNYAAIQLEILANIATPTEYANDRLNVQAHRLNNQLNNQPEEDTWQTFVDTETNWWLLGPTENEMLNALKARRLLALKQLKKEYGEELRGYE